MVRVIDTNNTVLLDDVSNVDNPEMVTLRTELAEIKTLMSTTRRMDTTPMVAGSTPRTWGDKFKEVVKMKSDSEEILKSKKSNKKSFVTGFSTNEPNEECSNCVSLTYYRVCTDSYVMPSSQFHALYKGPMGPVLVFNL